MDKRKIGIAAGAICLVLLAAVFLTKLRYESKVQGEIENFLAALPQPLSMKAEKIDVSFFDKSVTLTNLKGSYTFPMPQGSGMESMPMDFTFGRIAATGVNIDGFNAGAGVAKLVDSLTFADVTAVSPLASSAVERYVMEGVSADFAKVAEEFTKALPALLKAGADKKLQADNEQVRQVMTGVAGILKAYETVAVQKASFTNYKYTLDVDGQKIDMSLDSVEARDYSIRKMGPFSIKNLKTAMNGTAFMEAASVTSDEILLPSFVPLLETFAANPVPSPNLMKEAFKGQTFAVKNLKVQGLAVRHPMNPETLIFSLGDTDFNYRAADSHDIDFTFSNLNIDKALLQQEMTLPPQALASLPDIIAIDGVIQQKITPKDLMSCDVALKKFSLRGTGLGEASLSFAANDINVMAMRMGSPGNASLQKADLSMTDGGLGDVLFAVKGMHSERTAREMRDREVASLRQSLEREETAGGKTLLTGIIGFLEKPGGTLRVAVEPSAPVTLPKLAEGFNTDPATIGFSVTVTPGE